MKAFKEPTQAEKLKFETEERRTHAIENLLSKWAKPSKTATPAQQDTDDDGMWGKLLVNRIKTIKDPEVKEDFKQQLNVLALQAARGTWHISPVKSYAVSPKLGMARPAFMQQSPRLLASKQFTNTSASTQARAPHGPAGDFAAWSNARGQQMQLRCLHKWHRPPTPKCPLSLWPVPCGCNGRTNAFNEGPNAHGYAEANVNANAYVNPATRTASTHDRRRMAG